MAASNDVLDDMLAEAALLSEPDPDSAQPRTSGELTEIEQPRAKRARTSGKTGKAGAASVIKPVHAISSDVVTEAENGAKVTLEELSHKVTQLAEIINSFAPVVKELKGAYDTAQQQDGASVSEGEIEDDLLNDEATDSLPASQNGALVDDLVHEVTESEPTDHALPEKISTILNNILASGLNEQALAKRKESVKRPENCNLLRVTKVNPEIWDIARKPTRSMDARLQKLQEALIKGLIPISRFAGIVGESLGKDPKVPVLPPEELWEGLSTSVLLIASANHDLNMCRRDLFKADLDENYKAICSSKEPVAAELFGDDLTERLKTVKESKKAAQQLTSQKRKHTFAPRPGTSNTSNAHFLFQRRGGQSQGRPRGKFQHRRRTDTFRTGEKSVTQK
ncbi:Hypothetical predicted protein [Paramuricea clavata]|uniref:Uncharacterized protein n=1 Tax=Paramuricea clavata TaxID=317549 RepID=A0A6S7IFR8_PARCT|nr:Hypothetical predicted protein [Paramuricea clavata]